MEFEKLRAIICEILNLEPEEVALSSSFVDDLGADSLDVFQIMMGAEEEFDIEFPQDGDMQINTVGEAVEKIKELLNK